MAKKILVVDDEPDSLRLLSYFLSHEGYEVTVAKDGLAAMEMLVQSRFDLVLSDVKMPRMDGVALAQHIVSSVPLTPVLLMTAYHFDNLKTILALGIPCLRKPFSLTLLLTEIQKALENWRDREL